MNPTKLAKLRRRVRQRLAAIKRRDATHPLLRPSVNWAEVAEISTLLDEAGQDPDEWS
jgi:hypothetical protein